MAEVTKNFASSLVATAPSPATSGTSLTVASGQGTWFPDPAVQNFNAVVCPADARPTPSNAEVVRVTARSTDTFTITRTQEGSSARSIVVGDRIYAGVTAKTLSDITAGDLYDTIPAPGVRKLHLPRHTLTKASAQTIATGGFGTAIDFDTEAENADPGSVGAFTAVLGSDYLRVNLAGFVTVFGFILWTNNVTGNRALTIQHQDSSGAGKQSYALTQAQNPAGDQTMVSVTVLTAVNDRLKMVGYQNSGGDLATAGGGVSNIAMRCVFLTL